MLRIGHRGAAALAPENTIAAVRAAIEVGVDVVELDVSPGPVVGHCPGRPGPGLAAFLAELHDLAPAELELLLDLKGRGHEQAALAACVETGFAQRCAFSTGDLASLKALAGRARTSVTISPGRWPQRRREALVDTYRRSGARDATLRHDVVGPEIVAAVHAGGGRVLAWTVNTRRGIARMATLGCDGVITDDPRLFMPV